MPHITMTSFQPHTFFMFALPKSYHFTQTSSMTSSEMRCLNQHCFPCSGISISALLAVHCLDSFWWCDASKASSAQLVAASPCLLKFFFMVLSFYRANSTQRIACAQSQFTVTCSLPKWRTRGNGLYLHFPIRKAAKTNALDWSIDIQLCKEALFLSLHFQARPWAHKHPGNNGGPVRWSEFKKAAATLHVCIVWRLLALHMALFSFSLPVSSI